MKVIDLKTVYGETAKLASLPEYEADVLEFAGNGHDVTLTGPGPVWLYLTGWRMRSTASAGRSATTRR